MKNNTQTTIDLKSGLFNNIKYLLDVVASGSIHNMDKAYTKRIASICNKSLKKLQNNHLKTHRRPCEVCLGINSNEDSKHFCKTCILLVCPCGGGQSSCGCDY